MAEDKDSRELPAKECSNMVVSMVVSRDRLAMMILNPLSRHQHHLNHLDKAKAKEPDTPATKDHRSPDCHTGSDPKADQLDPNNNHNNKEVTSSIIRKTLSKITVTLAITHLTILLETPIPHLLLNLKPTPKTNGDKVAGANLTDLTESVKSHCKCFEVS